MIDGAAWPDRLVAPIGWDAFEADHWEKRPLVVRRERPDYFADILTLADFDAILSNLSAHSPRVRLAEGAGAGAVAPPRAPPDGAGIYDRANGTEALFARFRRGETIIVGALHEDWPPLRELCRALAERVSGAFQVNAYLTPRRSRGLRPHYDTHDVFVLQIHGAKRWRLFGEAARLPLPGQPHGGEVGKPGDRAEVVDLRPGDTIYIPRGWGHVADALDEMSLHLTVGAYPLNWAMLLLKGVEAALAADARFRESLPVGFARCEDRRAQAVERLSGLLDLLRSRLDPAALVEGATAGAELARQPRLDGHLTSLAELDRIDDEAPLRRMAGVSGTLRASGADVGLAFHGKLVTFPRHFSEELGFVAGVDGPFDIAAIPGAGSAADKRLIVRTLVEEGYLTIV